MKRIHLHWTAGADGVNAVELDAYHFIVARDGKIYKGEDEPEDNIPPLRSGHYAAHTLNANSYAIGVALDAMHGAREVPFTSGNFPITETQLDAMAALCADLCDEYNIPVTRKTVLTHAEVQPTLGIKQRAKWDIMWLPGMAKAADPIFVGDMLRQRISDALEARNPPPPKAPEPLPEAEDKPAMKLPSFFKTPKVRLPWNMISSKVKAMVGSSAALAVITTGLAFLMPDMLAGQIAPHVQAALLVIVPAIFGYMTSERVDVVDSAEDV